MDRIAVLIPCYNEEKTIGKVVQDFRKQLPEATIYVYDNNSSDRTAEIAREAGAVVRKESLQGKGNVIRRMFREVDAECYIITDGDDTYPAEYAREMADRVLQENVDMVVGDRLSATYFTENKRPFHNFGNLLVRKSINLLFRNKIKDIMTGYRAFSYGFVKTFPVMSKGFEIETEMTIHAVDKNLHISNIVIDYRDRPEGSESKLSTYSDGLRVLYHPFRFFGWIALILALIATGFLISILLEYVQTGLVPRFPTLIGSGFMIIAAIQALFSGLQLQTLVYKDRQDFEMRLIQVEREKRRESKNET